MHHEAKQFILSVKERFPDHFCGLEVIDCGSRDFNGNNREFFDETSTYLGIDLGPGKNVNLIAKVHEFAESDYTFDVVISTEALEHDPDWPETIVALQQLTRSGGLLIITCAGPGRDEHGTSRTGKATGSEYTGDYYRNVEPGDFELMDMHSWREYSIEANDSHKDLYFWGVRT